MQKKNLRNQWSQPSGEESGKENQRIVEKLAERRGTARRWPAEPEAGDKETCEKQRNHEAMQMEAEIAETVEITGQLCRLEWDCLGERTAEEERRWKVEGERGRTDKVEERVHRFLLLRRGCDCRHHLTVRSRGLWTAVVAKRTGYALRHAQVERSASAPGAFASGQPESVQSGKAPASRSGTAAGRECAIKKVI